MPDAPAKARPPEGVLFASAFRGHETEARSRQRTLMLVLAVIGLHAAALIGAASFWHGTPRRLEGETTRGEVLVLRLTALPPSAPVGDVTGPAPAPLRSRTARRPRPSRAPSPPRPAAAPRASQLAEPLSVGRPAGIPAHDRDSLAGRAVAGITQRALGPDYPGLLVEPPPATAPDNREDMARRYFEQMFRDRFEDVPYPHEARMAGIEGSLVLRISVGVQGQLVALGVLGPCPHPLLCEAAQEAVRHAAPFPPPPPALGDRVTVELPFNYHLE
ncbi:TonB family protein [Myxococcus sp. AB056]|uniref:TonB family protein n=1 Tax=Myxococcus sp. AB056 TaxID=2562792 RepID=UPI00114732FD|nr:TonB family protein [Myxococcus sp. AB056]